MIRLLVVAAFVAAVVLSVTVPALTLDDAAESARATVFGADTNIVIVSIHEHAVAIRKEEPFDMPCSTEERPSKLPGTIPRYVVDAGAFYDGDLHLILKPAYPKGC